MTHTAAGPPVRPTHGKETAASPNRRWGSAKPISAAFGSSQRTGAPRQRGPYAKPARGDDRNRTGVDGFGPRRTRARISPARLLNMRARVFGGEPRHPLVRHIDGFS